MRSTIYVAVEMAGLSYTLSDIDPQLERAITIPDCKTSGMTQRRFDVECRFHQSRRVVPELSSRNTAATTFTRCSPGNDRFSDFTYLHIVGVSIHAASTIA